MAKVFDLVDRSTAFTKSVIVLTRVIPKTPENVDFIRQLIRCSSSIGANYIEANDALGKRDFLMKIKTARREANEARYWLELLSCTEATEDQRTQLLDESQQLAKILSAIATKVGSKP